MLRYMPPALKVLCEKKHKKTGGKSSRKNASRSYQPISQALSDPRVFADTELGDGIRAHGMVNLFRAVFGKARRIDGECPGAILAALLVWPILKLENSSIHAFCSELGQFLKSRVDDCKYRANTLYFARAFSTPTPWVQTISERSSSTTQSRCDGARKVEGSSLHWDHTENRYVTGHQVVELGIAGEKEFLPVDRQIFMGEKEAVGKAPENEFRDKRCAAARDMERAKNESKHTMFRRMLKSALDVGFRAAYVLGDAWFGCKENIRASLVLGLVAIFQMKRGNMNYWLANPQTNRKAKCYTAPQLFNEYKCQLEASSSKARYRTYHVTRSGSTWRQRPSEPQNGRR